MNSPSDVAERPSGDNLPPPLSVNEAAEIITVQGAGERRVRRLFGGGMFVRYLLVGGLNTLVGYCSFVVILNLLGHVTAARYLYLEAPLASIISTPLSITFAYLGYKFFVFRTSGNYLMEWLKCFAVYGSGMLPGLFALGALTRLFQGLIHSHAPQLHAMLRSVEAHLTGPALHAAQQAAASRNIAGSLAGAIVMGFTTIYSFIGHRKVTFKPVAVTVPAANLDSPVS